MVHYDRFIVQDEEKFTKMIYGIKSEEIFKEAMSEVEDYYDFIKEVNNMGNASKETKYSVKQAIYIIENLYRMHEEDSINELTPKMERCIERMYESVDFNQRKNQNHFRLY
jgi:hypothetical protein